MPAPGKKWWHISACEVASLAGLWSFFVAILLPAVVAARARHGRDAPHVTSAERWLLRFCEAYWHGWVYLLGSVLIGASVAALVYRAASPFGKRADDA